MSKKASESDEGTVARWDPFSDLDLFQGFPSLGGLRPRLRRLAEERLPIPAIDVSESDDHYVVSAEIPGIEKEDIEVECHEGVLTIRGEKKSEREEKDEKRRWSERTYGSFSRSFRLPSDANPDKIDARFKNGVLTVEIPRSGERKPRTVAVKG